LSHALLSSIMKGGTWLTSLQSLRFGALGTNACYLRSVPAVWKARPSLWSLVWKSFAATYPGVSATDGSLPLASDNMWAATAQRMSRKHIEGTVMDHAMLLYTLFSSLLPDRLRTSLLLAPRDDSQFSTLPSITNMLATQ